MGQIVWFDSTHQTVANNERVDVTALRNNTRKLRSSALSIPEEIKGSDNVLVEHSAEPIKSIDEICQISQFLINKGRWRDNMLFIVGINFGLRVSDLISLRFSDIINPNLTFKDTFGILEKKTSETRKKKRNRYITINDAVMDAVTLYLEHTNGVSLNDYMFKSISNNGKNSDKPMSRVAVDMMLKGIASELGLNIRMSTHTLRKTFAYHQMLMSGNDPRKLLLLQKMFGHSTAAQTLDYIGITEEEIEEAYRNLNLGSHTKSYLIDSTVNERSEDLSLIC